MPKNAPYPEQTSLRLESSKGFQGYKHDPEQMVFQQAEGKAQGILRVEERLPA